MTLFNHSCPKSPYKMSVSIKKLLKTFLSGSVWIICGLIVVYQSILCVKKFIENPKGTEVFMTDGVYEMFPHFTLCSGTKPYKTFEGCNIKWLVQGDQTSLGHFLTLSFQYETG